MNRIIEAWHTVNGHVFIVRYYPMQFVLAYGAVLAMSFDPRLTLGKDGAAKMVNVMHEAHREGLAESR